MIPEVDYVCDELGVKIPELICVQEELDLFCWLIADGTDESKELVAKAVERLNTYGNGCFLDHVKDLDEATFNVFCDYTGLEY